MLPLNLEAVQAARSVIAPYTIKTPLLFFDYLKERLGKQAYVKCELFQKTGSFKIRGATACVHHNLAQAKQFGVVAASAGNHAQGVAAICRWLGIKATIVMPTTTPPNKIHNTLEWGAKTELFGTILDESKAHAEQLASQKGQLFIHPYKDPDVLAGQGTIALELIEEDCFDGVEAVVIPVGGGGLISGCISVLRALKPKVKIYGVTTKNAPATFEMFHRGAVVQTELKYTLADGVAVKQPDAEIIDFLKKNLEDLIQVREESIAHAIAVAAEHGKLVVEGAGALPLAAVLDGFVRHTKIVLLLSGGNIDVPVLSNVLQRGLVEQGRIVRLLVRISDRPGGLNSVTQILAQTQANILQVFHQRATLHAGVGETEIEVDIETRGKEHTKDIVRELSAHGFQVSRVT
ncbi:MAG: threonine ammonia-lyase [Deltaproteobacteria bacterium]|nr:threonine ammonia-lyase [Deltaproteobacteria bacterium]